MEEVQMSIPYTPLPAFNLYYRCSSSLSSAKCLLQNPQGHCSPRHAIIYEQSCHALRDRNAKFVIPLSILDTDSDRLKYRSKIVAWL